MAPFVPVEEYLDYFMPVKSEWAEEFLSPEKPTKVMALVVPEVWDEPLPEIDAWMKLQEDS